MGFLYSIPLNGLVFCQYLATSVTMATLFPVSWMHICAHESVKVLGFLQGFCINSTLYKWFCDIVIIIILNVGLSWTIVIDGGPFLLHMLYKSL